MPQFEAFPIPGPCGVLEAEGLFPAQTPNSVAVVCHPHSLYGGTMNNKVVHTLLRMFHRLGAAAVGFNFRGVGNSAGHYDEGKGEGDDLAAVVHYARERFGNKPLLLAGFSFGSYVAASRAHALQADHLISVAPPVTHFDFAVLPPMQIPWWIVQGDQDEVVDPKAVEAFIQTRNDIGETFWFSECGIISTAV